MVEKSFFLMVYMLNFLTFDCYCIDVFLFGCTILLIYLYICCTIQVFSNASSCNVKSTGLQSSMFGNSIQCDSFVLQLSCSNLFTLSS